MQRRPNLLFIFSDQHAAKATGCYCNRVADTPNLHRLAGEGVTFDNVYCPRSHMRRCAGDWSRKCYATGTRWRWDHRRHNFDYDDDRFTQPIMRLEDDPSLPPDQPFIGSRPGTLVSEPEYDDRFGGRLVLHREALGVAGDWNLLPD